MKTLVLYLWSGAVIVWVALLVMTIQSMIIQRRDPRYENTVAMLDWTSALCMCGVLVCSLSLTYILL